VTGVEPQAQEQSVGPI